MMMPFVRQSSNFTREMTHTHTHKVPFSALLFLSFPWQLAKTVACVCGTAARLVSLDLLALASRTTHAGVQCCRFPKMSNFTFFTGFDTKLLGVHEQISGATPLAPRWCVSDWDAPLEGSGVGGLHVSLLFPPLLLFSVLFTKAEDTAVLGGEF